MSKIILQDVVDQTVSNTVTETNLFVGTIPSGTWPGSIVAIEQTGRYQNNNQNSRTATIRLYVGSSGGTGGTQVTQGPIGTSLAASTLGHGTCQRWELYALDADSFRVVQRMAQGGPGSDGGAFGAVTSPSVIVTNRVEGLSGLTGATEIRITVQLSHTGTNHSFSSRGVWVGKVDEEEEEAAAGTTVSVVTAGF